MFIHESPSCPADMPRAGAEASVVSVPVLVLVGGVGRYLELRPDVDRRAVGAPLWRNLQGSSAGVGAAARLNTQPVTHMGCPCD